MNQQPSCSECGGTVIEYDAAAGNGFCVLCGTVLEENTIVNEVTFGETASGGAMVQGAFVGQGASEWRSARAALLPWMLIRFSTRTNGRSIWEQRRWRVQRTDNSKWCAYTHRYCASTKPSIASRKIQSIANVLRLSEAVSLAAIRLYTLAVEHKFTKGRKSMNVVAVCLYVACRQKETRNYMLIDFSDLLQASEQNSVCSSYANSIYSR
jgi:transcription factor IIIB 90 kDa subunit